MNYYNFCGNELHYVLWLTLKHRFVPVIKLDYRGVSLDILFARLKTLSTIPAFAAPDPTVSKSDRRNAKGYTPHYMRLFINFWCTIWYSTTRALYDGNYAGDGTGTDAFLDKLSSDDTILDGLDDTCVRSINGARVAIQILKLGSFYKREWFYKCE